MIDGFILFGAIILMTSSLLMVGCSSKKTAPSVAPIKAPANAAIKSPANTPTKSPAKSPAFSPATLTKSPVTKSPGNDKEKDEKKDEDDEKKDEEKKEKEDDEKKESKKDKKKGKKVEDDEKKESKKGGKKNKKEDDDEEKKKDSDEKDEDKKEDVDDKKPKKKETLISTDPSELRFESGITSQKKLRLKNLTGKKLMFKIKASTTNAYLINPVFGKIEPNGISEVVITHRPSVKREDKLVIITSEMVGKELEMAKTFKQIKITGADVTVKLIAT